MVLQTLVYIFGIVLIFNSVFTGILWYRNKEDLLKKLLFFWLTGLFAYVFQGVFNSLSLYGFLGFSINGLSAYFLTSILYDSFQNKVPSILFLFIGLVGFFTSIVMFVMGSSYTISVTPYVVSVVLILLISIIDAIKAKPDYLQKGFIFLIFMNTLHMADYPILRPQEDLAIFGFSASLVFFFSYSIYIPLFITKKLSERYTSNLQLEVKKRTSELNDLTEQLKFSNLSLEERNKKLDILANENEALINILVHDLSNPIQIISICNNKISKLITKPELDPIIGKIKLALHNIHEVIKTIRSLHALKIGKSALSLKKVNLVTICEELSILFEEKLNQKKLILRINSHSSEISTFSDPEILKNQVLANLLSNAIKFSPEGGFIDLFLFETKDSINIKLQDYGIGIPKELKKDIFSLSKPTNRLGTSGEKGTGLGLPIVKKYSEIINSDIHILETKENESGTCFELQFKKVN
ncbi:MAG: HAMP domain-containing histidine kinase [Deltaproteobacteria bacterium]|nr:HAMP domain-containing histidine kinase [Deltaproteobacteria bacterium]